MDIPRPDRSRQRRLKRILYPLGGALVLALVTLGLSRLKPAAPTVERASIWIDTVKRGPMVRQVRGLGTLVPEEVRWIPAVTEGRVERVLLRPGRTVDAGTVLIELSNPELEQAAQDAALQVKAAEAEYAGLKVRLDTQLLDQQAAAATVESDFHQARIQAERNDELGKHGLVSEIDRELSRVKADELRTRNEIEQKRLSIGADSVRAQLAAQEARTEQLRALDRLRREQVRSLKVRAGTDGVLQQMAVEVGQRVAPGATLAKVADPRRLKAELKIVETQAKDVQIGQSAVIDTRNGTVTGRVTRIDPAVQNGTVTVDVAMEGPLPKGARPDLSVDGTIELERLDDILYVGRPALAQSEGPVGLFKVAEGGRESTRVKVRLGRASVNTIEVLEGLREGDQVVLSDMSAWDAFDRIRLN